MIEAVVALILVLLAFLLPVKWAFGLSLATSYSLFYYLIADVATAMFVILFIRVVLKKGIRRPLGNKLFQNHALLVGFSILSLLWVTSFEMGISIVVAQIKVLIIAVVSLSLIETKSDLRFVMYGAMLGLVYICIVLTGWRFGLFGISRSTYAGNIEQYGRLLIQYFFPDRHTPLNSNTWASLASLSGSLVAAYYFYFVPNPKKTIKFFFLGFVLLVIIITADLGSRAAVLCTLGGVILLFKSIPPKRYYTYVAMILLLFYTGSLTVEFIAQFLPEGSEVIQGRLSESENEDPREKIWLTGLNMAVNNPVIGVGIGNSGINFKDYAIADFQNDKLALHNSFITHFAELGIFGLILFIRGMYLWQKPLIFRRSTKTLLIVVSLNILLNAFAHSFELENYFIAIIYCTHAYFLLEEKEAREILEERARETQAAVIQAV